MNPTIPVRDLRPGMVLPWDPDPVTVLEATMLPGGRTVRLRLQPARGDAFRCDMRSYGRITVVAESIPPTSVATLISAVANHPGPQLYDARGVRLADDGVILPARWGRSLLAVGIPARRVLVGFSGHERYGIRPVVGLVVTNEEVERLRDYRERTRSRRKAAAARRRAAAERKRRALESLAESMNLLPDSRTFSAYLGGEVDYDTACRIGRYMAWRHEETSYDALIAAGVEKEEAREMIAEEAGLLDPW